jgi:hypothetical protein
MKIRFYVDLWPGINPLAHSLCAWSQPPQNASTAKRLAFDVQIPDALLFDIDAISPEVGKVEVVADHEDA